MDKQPNTKHLHYSHW